MLHPCGRWGCPEVAGYCQIQNIQVQAVSPPKQKKGYGRTLLSSKGCNTAGNRQLQGAGGRGASDYMPTNAQQVSLSKLICQHEIHCMCRFEKQHAVSNVLEEMHAVIQPRLLSHSFHGLWHRTKHEAAAHVSCFAFISCFTLPQPSSTGASLREVSKCWPGNYMASITILFEIIND